MKTLQSIIPELNNAQLTLIWREIEGLIGDDELSGYPPHPTYGDTMMSNEMYARNQLRQGLRAILKQFIGGHSNE